MSATITLHLDHVAGVFCKHERDNEAFPQRQHIYGTFILWLFFFVSPYKVFFGKTSHCSVLSRCWMSHLFSGNYIRKVSAYFWGGAFRKFEGNGFAAEWAWSWIIQRILWEFRGSNLRCNHMLRLWKFSHFDLERVFKLRTHLCVFYYLNNLTSFTDQPLIENYFKVNPTKALQSRPA